MSEQKQLSENSSLLNILSAALACPGIKISRDDFLRETFSHFDESLRKKVIEEGPVAAGCRKETLRRIAKTSSKGRHIIRPLRPLSQDFPEVLSA